MEASSKLQRRVPKVLLYAVPVASLLLLACSFGTPEVGYTHTHRYTYTITLTNFTHYRRKVGYLGEACIA